MLQKLLGWVKRCDIDGGKRERCCTTLAQGQDKRFICEARTRLGQDNGVIFKIGLGQGGHLDKNP